jgi:hypothetical protein
LFSFFSLIPLRFLFGDTISHCAPSCPLPLLPYSVVQSSEYPLNAPSTFILQKFSVQKYFDLSYNFISFCVSSMFFIVKGTSSF